MTRRYCGLFLCGLVSLAVVSNRVGAVSLTGVACDARFVAMHTAKNVLVLSALAAVVVPLIAPLLYRGKKLSPETEQAVRKTLREMGVEDVDSVTLREFNWLAQKLFGKENACAMGGLPFLPRHVLISQEKWLNKLSDAERRFLVGHEGAHLNRIHIIKTVVALAFAEGLARGSAALIKRELARKRWNGMDDRVHAVAYLTTSVAAAVAPLCLRALVSRRCERQADTDAADQLCNAAGGQALMKRFNEQGEKRRAKRAKKFFGLLGTLDQICALLNSKTLASHPSHEKRIAYLEKMAEEQRNSKQARRPAARRA